MNKHGRRQRLFEPLESRSIPAASLLAEFIAAIPQIEQTELQSAILHEQSYVAVASWQSSASATEVLAVLEDAPRSTIVCAPNYENTDALIREFVLTELTRFAEQHEIVTSDPVYQELVDIVLQQIGDGNINVFLDGTND